MTLMLNKEKPSLDLWLKEAKTQPEAGNVGMYLCHNGVVRASAKATVREGCSDVPSVCGMRFSYDARKVDEVIEEALSLSGIYVVRVWLNDGELNVGDDLMYVLIGGDIRPNVVSALEHVVGRLKNACVHEEEIFN